MDRASEWFVKRIEEAVSSALKDKIVLTKFLDQTQIEVVHRLVKSPVSVYFHGGYADAEMKRALIGVFDDPPAEETFRIRGYRITTSSKSSPLSHKDVFGTLMNMGIERETFGDIVSNGECFLFVALEMSEYFEHNLTKVKGVPVDMIRIGHEDQALIQKKMFEKKTIIVPSLRLDAIVARVMPASREKSQIHILNQLVKINHKICENPSQICRINDIISIRTVGRVTLLSEVQKTKKGNIVLEIGILR